MATYYVDDGGNGSDGSSWANAYTTLWALDSAVTLAAGDIVYVGHDSVDGSTGASTYSLTGPSSGAPVSIISATSGSNPPTYQKATAAQIANPDGSIRFYNNVAMYGVQIDLDLSTESAANLIIDVDDPGFFFMKDFVVNAAPDQAVIRCFGSDSLIRFEDGVIDMTADTGANTVFIIEGSSGLFELTNVEFANGSSRSGYTSSGSQSLFYGGSHLRYVFSGCDFTSLTGAESLFHPCPVEVNNCDMPSAFVIHDSDGLLYGVSEAVLHNCSDTYAPWLLEHSHRRGFVSTTGDVYKSIGARINGFARSWVVTTTSYAREEAPLYTPWIYFEAAAGAQTFSLSVVNDTYLFTNEDIWLEVEYLASSGSGLSTLTSGQRANLIELGTLHSTDTEAIWDGLSPAFTYKQLLSVSVTVGQPGLCRGRVCIGKPSVVSSDYLYVDPQIEIS